MRRSTYTRADGSTADGSQRTRLVTAAALALWLVSLASGGATVAFASGDAAGGHEAHAVAPPPPVNWANHSWRGKNVYGGKLGSGLDANGKQYTEPGTDEEMSAPFMWVIINFTVAFLLIAWKAGPPLRRYLETRHLSISESLEEAAKLREQAKDKLDEYTARIADVEKEVQELIASIRADAKAEKERIIADAERQAAALKRDAEERIASEIARARIELQREVVLAAVNAADKLLREKTSPSDKQTLANDFIASVENAQQERA